MMAEHLSSSWLLDTGACHHIIGNDLYLINPLSTSTRSVGLPDGQTVKLVGGLILKNVPFCTSVALHSNFGVAIN